MFSFRLAILDLLGQLIDTKKKKITREIMVKNASRMTAGASIQSVDGMYNITNLHMADLHDLYSELGFLINMGHNPHIIETIHTFAEKVIWADQERNANRVVRS